MGVVFHCNLLYIVIVILASNAFDSGHNLMITKIVCYYFFFFNEIFSIIIIGLIHLHLYHKGDRDSPNDSCYCLISVSGGLTKLELIKTFIRN